eukprot:831928-Pelagomonas_calceolata.AAC.2
MAAWWQQRIPQFQALKIIEPRVLPVLPLIQQCTIQRFTMSLESQRSSHLRMLKRQLAAKSPPKQAIPTCAAAAAAAAAACAAASAAAAATVASASFSASSDCVAKLCMLGERTRLTSRSTSYLVKSIGTNASYTSQQHVILVKTECNRDGRDEDRKVNSLPSMPQWGQA